MLTVYRFALRKSTREHDVTNDATSHDVIGDVIGSAGDCHRHRRPHHHQLSLVKHDADAELSLTSAAPHSGEHTHYSVLVKV